MASFGANRILSGSFAEIWIDGSRIAEASAINLTVKAERSDVQVGMDVDSKIVGYRGTGEITLRQVFTRFYDILEAAQKGIDTRVTIITALKDPDSMGGAEERYSVAKVAFSELPLINYQTGKINEQKIKFTFLPGELKKITGIAVTELN